LTSYGRVVAVVSIFLGLSLGSILTAAIANILQWSPEEMTILNILQRQKARKELKELAINALAVRMRQYLNTRRLRLNSGVVSRDSEASADGRLVTQSSLRPIHSQRQGVSKQSSFQFVRQRADAATRKAMQQAESIISATHEVTGKLRRLQLEINRDDDNCLSDKFKVDRLHARTKFVQMAVEDVYDRLLLPHVLTALLHQRVKRKLSYATHYHKLHEYAEWKCTINKPPTATPGTKEHDNEKTQSLGPTKNVGNPGNHDKRKIARFFQRLTMTENAASSPSANGDGARAAEAGAQEDGMKRLRSTQQVRLQKQQHVDKMMLGFHEKLDWRRNKKRIHDMLRQARFFSGVFATLGNVAAWWIFAKVSWLLNSQLTMTIRLTLTVRITKSFVRY